MQTLKALWNAAASRNSQNKASDKITVDGLEVLWRKSARRKQSLALKLDKNGQLIAMTPMRTPKKQVQDFVNSRRVWIDKQLQQFASLQTAKDAAHGVLIWFEGACLTIEAKIGRPNQILREADKLIIQSRQALTLEALDKRAKKWLRKQAEQLLPEYLDAISKRTGMHGSSHQIKSYTARWGSCRHDGLIQLNWKLIMAPREVIEYVIIHELCHLEDFNHSSAFWARVARHCPSYNTQRQWLKQHGRLLITEL